MSCRAYVTIGDLNERLGQAMTEQLVADGLK